MPRTQDARPVWEQEIVELHEFLEGWLGGTLPDTDEQYQRLEDALAPGFTMVTPDGRPTDRDKLTAQLRAAHGARPGLRIWIERPNVVFEDGPTVLATYEEWQALGEDTSARLSTVLMTRDKDAPHGMRWQHVHETWQPVAGEEA